MPGWLLAALVAACLATAAWMFWVDARLDEPASTEAATEAEREQADSVLDVPEDEDADADDADRREDAGRDRLEAGAGSDEDRAGDDEESDVEPEPLPPVFQQLSGHTIALAPASIGSRVADRVVRVGGLRVPCSGAADADRIEAERALIARVREVLERAGAEVLEPVADCVDARVQGLEQGDLAVVIRSGDDAARVYAGRPTAATTAAARRASATFAAELAGSLDLRGPTSGDSDRARKLLADVGAIDLDGGASMAYIESNAASDEAADEMALAIARAMALTLARADRD